MNQIYSSSRFLSYFKLYTRENSRRILMLYAFVVILPIVAVLILSYLSEAYRYEAYRHIDRMWKTELLTFDFLLILMGAYFGSLFYSGLSEKGKRISFLMTPASSFEKFLTMFAIYVVGFMALFFVSNFLADITRVAVYSSTAHENGAFIDFIPLKYLLTQSLSEEMKDTIDVQNTEFYYQMAFLVNSAVFGIFFFLQAFFVLGSSVWPKNSFIKTFMTGTVIFFVSLFLFFLGMHTFFDWDKGIDWRFGEETPTTFGFLIAGTAAVFSLACWIISYIRFREWEAIKRW